MSAEAAIKVNRSIKLRADGRPMRRLPEPRAILETDEPDRYVLVDVAEGKAMVWDGEWRAASVADRSLVEWAIDQALLDETAEEP